MRNAEDRKLHLWLIRFVGLIVPARLRPDWRQEWEAELRHREALLAQWDKLHWQTKLDLLRRSTSAFVDALWLLPKRWEDEMIQDLRFGLRMLWKSPVMTMVAILSLAIGIGANTAIFSVANAVLLRPVAVQQPERVMTMTSPGGRRDLYGASYPKYQAFVERNQVFTEVLCWGELPLSLSMGELAVTASGMLVSGNYFAVLGVQPALGRFFTPDEDRTPGTHPVMVISYGLWQRRFGGDPNVVGKEVTLNGYPFIVIGVVPQDFTSTMAMLAPDAWVPLMMESQVLPQDKDLLTSPTADWLMMTGRLKPGVTVAQAEANLSAIALQLEAEYPQQLREEGAENETHSFGIKLIPVGGFPPNIRNLILSFLGLLQAIVGLVLLIACANLTSLLLARAMTRRKEIAVRLALGASRWRIVRQLLAESVLLCLLGGSAGLLLAVWINRLLLALKPAVDLPLVLDLRLDWHVMGAAFVLSLLTGVLFGLAPAWQSARPDVVVALKDEARSPSRHASRLRNAFVVAQIALSFLLLVCAGLFIRALSEGQKNFAGLEPERVQTVTYDPRFIGYDKQRAQEFYRQLLERARALPGVKSASLAAGITVGGGGRNTDFEVAGKDKRLELPVVHFNIVSPGYLATLKIRLLQGRDFSAADRTRGVAIIDETAAQQWFEGADALGQRLIRDKTEFEIIGIAERGNQRLSGATAQPFIYLPYAPAIGDLLGTRMILHVRTALPSPEIYAALRHEVGQLDRQIAAQYPMSLADYIRLATLPQRLVAALAGVLGLLGLALAAIGIFGVISYAVTQRTHEIGIRMALGAQPRDVLGLILRQGVSVIACGLTIGLLVAWATTRLLTALLYGVSATDPLTFGGVALLLLSIALLACYLPARNATKVDPLIALRRE